MKLVDHTAGTVANLLQAIQRDTQSLFDEAFDGTNLTVAVAWGAAAGSDNDVVHFVEDETPTNSYLLQKMPHVRIDPRAGGHTKPTALLSGTEIYKFSDSSRTQARGLGYAKRIVHEFFHNQLPFFEKAGANRDGSDPIPCTVYGRWWNSAEGSGAWRTAGPADQAQQRADPDGFFGQDGAASLI